MILPVWRARSGSGGNRPWIEGSLSFCFFSNWNSYDFAREALVRACGQTQSPHPAPRSLRASASRATVRQRDVGRCQLRGACAPTPVANPSRPPRRSPEIAAWLVPSTRSPNRKRVIPPARLRLDRTPGDDAVDAEAARATLRARAASSNVASRASRSPRSAPARARPFPPRPSGG